MGTAAGTKIFLQHGWRAAAALSLGWMGFQLVTLLLRGPHVPRKRWVGWKGGWSLRRMKDQCPPSPPGDVERAAEDSKVGGKHPAEGQDNSPREGSEEKSTNIRSAAEKE